MVCGAVDDSYSFLVSSSKHTYDIGLKFPTLRDNEVKDVLWIIYIILIDSDLVVPH